MRAAGIFSHLVLAFVCASLTALASPSLKFMLAVDPVGSATVETSDGQTAPVPSPLIAAAPAAVVPQTAGEEAAPKALIEPVAPVDTPQAEATPATAAPATAAPAHSGVASWSVPARVLEVAASAATPVPEPVAESAAPPLLTTVTAGPPPVSVTASSSPPSSPLPPMAAAPPAPPAPVRVAAATPDAVIAVPQPPALAPHLPGADPHADPAANGGTPGLKPAKVLFGAVTTPAPLAARAIGSYARGCLAGAEALPVDGETWQAMRLSRNRNWGHPQLIKLIEKLSVDGKEKDGWPGLLVGDIAQPRGGPMITGHASHQIGLDADIWLTPMPDRRLTNKERETVEATSMLGEDGLSVNRDVWTEAHLNILKRAAGYPDVERIFVHPAIKQVLCYAAKDDRSWLSKVRPYWGHHYHFHVRIHCPPGSTDCTPQASVPGDDGCGTELDDWLKRMANIKPEPAPLPLPAPPVVAAKPKEKPPMTLDQLPQSCSVVLAKDNPKLQADIAAAEAATAAAAKAAEAAKAAKLAEAAQKSAAKSAARSAAMNAHAAGATAPSKSLAAKPHTPGKSLSAEKKSDTQ